jgi:hypothetical protein
MIPILQSTSNHFGLTLKTTLKTTVMRNKSSIVSPHGANGRKKFGIGVDLISSP